MTIHTQMIISYLLIIIFIVEIKNTYQLKGIMFREELDIGTTTFHCLLKFHFIS